jgi:RHS repeat-associated protein
VQKAVFTWNGSAWTLASARRFIYNGWNMVAEFDAPGGTSFGSLQRSFAWGLDIAGSLSATGGVGSLLQITDHALSKSYFPAYDANGNVMALYDSADGAAAAVYEYSPFGEMLRSEGTYAASNPFRFSTKFADDETGLLYYGHRYYSPSLGRRPQHLRLRRQQSHQRHRCAGGN